jgi:glucan-binding YG repeat protein
LWYYVGDKSRGKKNGFFSLVSISVTDRKKGNTAMKKTLKLMTALLAVIMMLQAAPLSAIGDTTLSDSYEVDNQEDVTPETEPETEVEPETEAPSVETEAPETEAPETEAPETEAPETEAPETEIPEEETEEETEAPAASVTIYSVLWKNAKESGGYKNLANGQVMDCNYISIVMSLSAIPQSVEVLVNGVEVLAKVDEKTVTTSVELLNGYHTLSITVNGTESSTTKEFDIQVAGDDSSYPSLSISGASALILGETSEIVLTAQNADLLSELLVNITMSSSFKVESVDIAKGYVGTYSWYRGNLELSIEVYDENKINGDVLATIRVKAPATVTPDESLSWEMDSAVVTPDEDSDIGASGNFVGTVTAPKVEVSVSEVYVIEGVTAYAVNRAPYTLLVKNLEGQPVTGVSVYALKGKKGVLIGETDENGMLTTEYFNGKSKHSVYAEDEEGRTSFVYSFYTYEPVGSEDGIPYALLQNGINVGGKTFSWMSHLNSGEISYVRIATAADMSDAVLYSGSSSVKFYQTDMSVNRIHSVTVSDLTPGVYYYQVGDGNVWSDTKAFTVKASSQTTSFVVLGDMANSSLENLALIGAAIKNDGSDYDFAIQTGNVLADTNKFESWINAADAFAAMGDMDIIHTLGKDEQSAGAAYGAEEAYRTYVYGGIFVAVINYTEDEAALADMLQSMVWDAKDQAYAWRVLVINQAPYSTNADKAASIASALVPDMAEMGGIDLVLSGDECAYARTDALREGAVTEKNGVTYVVCGSAGEKNETAVSGEFAVTNENYNAMYISVNADEHQLTLTAYNVLSDGSIEVVDTVTKTRFACAHGEHAYRFGINVHSVICDYCGDRQTVGEYYGPALYKDLLIYLKGYNFGTGWLTHYGKTYYFSPKNLQAVNGVQTIGVYTYVFENNVLTEGCWVTIGGVKKLVWAGEVLTNTWHTQAATTYYFLSNGAYATGEVEITETNENGETVVKTYVFDENGALIGEK